jgi:hypothetical protein
MVGRSAPPFEVPGWLKASSGEAAMKKAIVEQCVCRFGKPTPKDAGGRISKTKANLSIAEPSMA